MRLKAQQLLAGYPKFTSVAATAEETTLDAGSVDLITAGQAFHWFEPQKTKTEFSRIGSVSAQAVLIWNERQVVTLFENAYENLLHQYATDYTRIDHRNITPEKIRDFFHPHPVSCLSFENEQIFDFEGLKGRLLSSSYIPPETDRNHTAMIGDLHRIFKDCAVKGKVRFGYTTLVYAGRIN
jgi:hypothetical protein